MSYRKREWSILENCVVTSQLQNASSFTRLEHKQSNPATELGKASSSTKHAPAKQASLWTSSTTEWTPTTSSVLVVPLVVSGTSLFRLSSILARSPLIPLLQLSFPFSTFASSLPHLRPPSPFSYTCMVAWFRPQALLPCDVSCRAPLYFLFVHLL